MANKHRGEVDIEIGGQVRVLRYDMNALAELETDLGASVGALFDDPGIRVIRQAIYTGLKAGGMRKVTVNQVGQWMNFQHMEHYGEKLAEALGLALGTGDEEVDDAGPLDLVLKSEVAS